MLKHHLFTFSLVVLSCSATAAPLDATWLGGSGNWDEISNWSYSAVTAANFPNNGLDTFSVIIDNDDSIDSIASLNTNATIDALTVGIGDQLKLNNNFSLRIENSIANNGIIALTDNGISSPTTLEINETVSYSGNGVFENTFITQNRIVGTGVLPTLINQTDLIGKP